MTNKTSNMDNLHTMPVRQAVFKNAIPAMLAMLMVLVYNMADLFFIGQTGDDLQVAAISMATPLFLIFMSIGNVFGIGGASLLSRSLGSGKYELVKKISSFCFWSVLVIGLMMSVIAIASMDSIVAMLGASGNIASMVKSYLILISISGVFILISSCYSALVRAEGKPKNAMTGMMLGNLVNIILDPIFILVFDLGVVGAAIATLIGNVVGGSYYLFYLAKGETMLSTKRKYFTLSSGIPRNVLIIGIPASLSSILMSCSQMIINGQMATYGDLAVAGIGVAMKVTMITTMVCIGLGQGIQPLLGYAIGSQNQKRYKEVFRFSILFALTLSASLTILCYLCLSSIVSAFVSDPASFEYAYSFAQMMLSTSVLTSVLFVIANALQAAGVATSALIINISKQGIVYIPLLFIMGGWLGINGLVCAQPMSDVITLTLAVVLYRKVSKTFFMVKQDEEGVTV